MGSTGASGGQGQPSRTSPAHIPNSKPAIAAISSAARSSRMRGVTEVVMFIATRDMMDDG